MTEEDLWWAKDKILMGKEAKSRSSSPRTSSARRSTRPGTRCSRC